MRLDGIEYDHVSYEPCRYRCAWDDRFALAATMYRTLVGYGNRVAIEFTGESLLTDYRGIATYKTAILTMRKTDSINIPEGCTKVKVVNVMPTREQFEASLQGGSPFITIEPEPKTETWRDRAIKDPLF